MIYNQISSKAIIAKVLSEFDVQEENFREADVVEWVGDALEKIGAFPSFNIKITGKEELPLLKVSDFQTKLPEDLINIIGVQFSPSESGNFIPLRAGTGTYGYRGENTGGNETTGIAPTTDIVTAAMDLYDWTYEEALVEINDDPALKSKISTYLVDTDFIDYRNRNRDDLSGDQYIYYINNNYIKLNVRSGYLKVAYQAMPLDEEGYPLIPDSASFMEAVYWYIITKLLYPRWVQGAIRDAVYYDARSNWNYYCKQAYGQAMMPSPDKMEALKNKWLQFYPEVNDFDSNFSSTGNKQTLYNR